MSAKNKKEKAREKLAAGTGLTVARVIEVLRDLPGDAEVRAGDGRIAVTGPYVAAALYDSGEVEVEVGGCDEGH